ncbi:hypothetical protein H4217_003822 [Coemansia sp. RSA 1939]|nr:hypothetical protein H4217_003822 [Coemansia sp. RSA 1939]KAJ2608076.1 hypothetical protein EV177_005174 [Coemansia sp. RSA 1804]
MFRNVLARTSAGSCLAARQQVRNLAASTVYIKRIPLDMTKERLTAHLEQFGPVYDVNMKEIAPSDTHHVAFVKFYAGELPDSVDELCNLPFPTTAEIDKAMEISTRAIREINSQGIDGEFVQADHSKKNKPDSIQFYTRFTMQKVDHGIPPPQRPTIPNNKVNTSSDRQSYMMGYQEGFKNGVAEGRRLARNIE